MLFISQLDRMAVDCAHELRRHNVACVSLWPGAVQTENIMGHLAEGNDHTDPQTGVKVNYTKTMVCLDNRG